MWIARIGCLLTSGGHPLPLPRSQQMIYCYPMVEGASATINITSETNAGLDITCAKCKQEYEDLHVYLLLW